jgi:hypothetical protein
VGAAWLGLTLHQFGPDAGQQFIVVAGQFGHDTDHHQDG